MGGAGRRPGPVGRTPQAARAARAPLSPRCHGCRVVLVAAGGPQPPRRALEPSKRGGRDQKFFLEGAQGLGRGSRACRKEGAGISVPAVRD